MAVAMALSTMATCVQKRFEAASQTHTEPLCLWTLTGSDPGTRKSAVVMLFTHVLSMWEKGQGEILKPEISRVGHIIDFNQERVKRLKQKAAKSGDPIARDECLREIMTIENTTPAQLVVPRLYTDDATPEKLANLLYDNKERMAIISDEGGTFEVLSGLYSNGKSNINTYLKSHAGMPVRVDRQLGSVILEKPALSFGLAVQPQIIADLAQGNKARLRGNGMLARFLYFIPKSNVGTRDVRNRYVIPDSLNIAYQNLVFKLLSIPALSDEKGNERPRMLTLSPDALDAWLQFSAYVESEQGDNGEFHSIQDWTSKLPGAALRIAGIFHVCEHLETIAVITLETMERALDLCELLIPHAKAAFDLMGSIQEVDDAKLVYRWLKTLPGDRFKQREAFVVHDARFKKMERLKKALDVLIERHIISKPITLQTGGRPSIVHMINPLAREAQK
jgi:putative DNA primase/helicase